MPLQDLTPQLRMRLSKVERAVGWFVILAALLLVAGFLYYAWHTATRKGWFLTKISYQTGVNNAAGLKIGDPVKLMGRDVGEITDIVPNNPEDWYGMTVYFSIKAPNYGYIWSDSMVRVAESFLGNRYLEVTKGKAGPPTVLEANKQIVGLVKDKLVRDRFNDLRKAALQGAAGWDPAAAWGALKAQALADQTKFYHAPDRSLVCWIEPDEAPALNERLEKLANQVEVALPNLFALTNRLAVVLDQGILTASNASALLTDARPVMSNLAQITAQIRDPHGSLGEWLIPTDLQRQLTGTLATANSTLLSANTTLTNTDAQITLLASELDRTLEHLSSITSNLNSQVAANTNLVKEVSDTIIHADDLIQGLKRHWLLRSAFKTNSPPKTMAPVPSPKVGKWR
jgi:ABC-type transporter Mla subunit MlaD